MRDRLVRWRWWLGGAAVIAVGALVAVIVWPSPAPAPYRPAARARVYNTVTICLLTGPLGVAGTDAAPVWAGVTKAADAANGQSQFLSATTTPETVGSVTPFANSLVQQQCALVVAVGPVEVAAVESIAPTDAKTRFLVVGKGTASANVKVVTDTSTNSVAAAVQADL
ncbi:MAG TPA: hypothetical protein VGX23_22690 [Actinocrinis sp.]|nr:hypothetical protein [Actinocrinis sp.]